MPAVPTMANCCACDYTVRGCTVQVTVPFAGAVFQPELFLQDCAPSLLGDHPCTPNPSLCFTKVPELRALRIRYRITEYDPVDGVTVWLEDLKEYSRYYGDLEHHKITDGCEGPCPGFDYDPCVGLRYEFTVDDANNCTLYGPVDITNTRCVLLAPWGLGWDCDAYSNEDGTYQRLIAGDCDRAGGFYHMEETWYEDVWNRQDCEATAVALAQYFEPPTALPHSENFKRVKLSGRYPSGSIIGDACSRTFYQDDGTGESVAFGRWDFADLQVLQPAGSGFAACPRVNKLHAHYERGALGASEESFDSGQMPARILLAADTYTGLKRAMGTQPVPFDCLHDSSIGFWGWIRMKNTLIAGSPLDVYRHQCCADWLAYRRWPSGNWRVSFNPPDVDCLETVGNCSSAQVALGQLEHPKYTPIVQAWDDEACAEMGEKRCEAEVAGREVWTFPVPGPYEVWGIGPDDCFTSAGATCASGSTPCSGDTAQADGACPPEIDCVPNTLPSLCPGGGNFTAHDSCAT